MAPPATTLPRARARPVASAPRPPARAAVPAPPAAPPPPVPRGPSQRRRVLLWMLRWTFMVSVWGALAVAVLLLWFARDLPRPEDALEPARRPSLVLQDRNGRG